MTENLIIIYYIILKKYLIKKIQIMLYVLAFQLNFQIDLLYSLKTI